MQLIKKLKLVKYNDQVFNSSIDFSFYISLTDLWIYIFTHDLYTLGNYVKAQSS